MAWGRGIAQAVTSDGQISESQHLEGWDVLYNTQIRFLEDSELE